MRIVVPALALLGVAPAAAGGLTVSVEVPKLSVAEYHKPYVAIWIEKPDASIAANLAVWYDVKLKDREGEKWLKDMRQWWRRIGREMTLPADGVSGATRAPGVHEVDFSAGQIPLGDLAPGEYSLVVEAAREVGGRELVKLPFTWPLKDKRTATGSSELGAISIAPK